MSLKLHLQGGTGFNPAFSGGCGCCCWALPLSFWLCFLCLFGGLLSDDETQIWLGDLRVVGFCGADVILMLPGYVTTASYTYFVFIDASLSEP